MIKRYIIKEKDTLRSIAKQYYGNPNVWIQLAIENNLEYPYIGETGVQYAGKVLYPGDSIMLTFSRLDSENIYFTERNVSNINYNDILMGTDIGLTGGQLMLVGSYQGIDFYTVKGMANIKQAIEHKFKVKKGGLFYYPGYGTLVPVYIGKVADSGNFELIKAEVVKTIMEDSRIESIPSLFAEFDGYDTINISANLKLIGNFSTSVQIRINASEIRVN